MIGSYLSRWTMSYFAVAIAWLFVAEGLMVCGLGFPAADIAAPATLVLVHVTGIGWLSIAMCGALFQFVPVLVARPLFSERPVLPALGLLTAGLVALVGGFVSEAGWTPPWFFLFPLAAMALCAGFGLVIADVGLTIWRARPLANPACFVSVGLASMGVAMTLGAAFAFALAGHGGMVSTTILSAGVPIHAIAALGGWLTMISIGVSYRLLSMFMLSPDVEARRSRITLLAGVITMVIVFAGGFIAIARGAGLQLILVMAAAGAVVTIALYARDIAGLYRNRVRRRLEINTRMTACAYASLAAAVLLGLVLVGLRQFALHAGAFVFLIAFGWLSGLLLAQLYKIVAFLTWLETYGPVMGRTPTPRVQDLVVERRATKWFIGYFASVWFGTALLLLGAASAFRVVAALMALSTAGIVCELVRTRRLMEVGGGLRLPNGAALPGLLFSRV